MHTHADTHIHVQTPHAHTDPHVHTDLHTQRCTRTKTHTHACVHKSSQTHIDMCTDRHTNTAGPLKAHTRPRAQKRAHSDTQTHTQRHRCRPLTYPPHRNTITRAPEETPPNHTDTHMQKCTRKDPHDTTYIHTNTHTDSSLHTHTRAGPHRPSPSRHAHAHIYMCIPVPACLPHSPSRQRGPGVLPAVLQRIHSRQAVGGLVPDPGRLSQQRHCVSLPLSLPSVLFLPQETNVGGGGPQSSRKGHCGGERSDSGLHLLSPWFCSSGLLHSTLREPPKDLRL